MQGAPAVTHFAFLHFSPALNFVLFLLVVRFILSRISEARDFNAFRLSGVRSPRGIGANRRSSRFLHFEIAQHADHGSNGLAMRSDVPRLRDALETCAKPFESVHAPSPRRCDKPLLETLNSNASSGLEPEGSATGCSAHHTTMRMPRC